MQQPSKRAPHTDFQILLFIISLCFIAALILAVIAYSLRIPQLEAKVFDQSKQMLIAAKILNHSGNFVLLQEDGTLVDARFDPEKKILVPETSPSKATAEEIKQVADLRIRPLLTDKNGNVFTFEEKNLTLSEYLSQNKKTGYANLPLKLFYAILPNEQNDANITFKDLKEDFSKGDENLRSSIYGVVIPISGFGLWAPIFGFIALEPNGDEVIGTTWYEHAETPGLGANIAEPWWQKQFYGKMVFQESSGGKTDFQSADLGIIVVKGKVQDVYGSSPKSKSAVDGMSGATLTGDGVTQAYRDSLTPYREFLIKMHEGSNGRT